MKTGDLHRIETVHSSDRASDIKDLVLILQDDDAFLHESSKVLIVPLSAPPAEMHGHPLVKIAPTAQNGLTTAMVARIDRIQAIDRARIAARIGEIDRSTLIDVYRVLDRLIGRSASPQRTSGSGDTLHTKL